MFDEAARLVLPLLLMWLIVAAPRWARQDPGVKLPPIVTHPIRSLRAIWIAIKDAATYYRARARKERKR